MEGMTCEGKTCPCGAPAVKEVEGTCMCEACATKKDSGEMASSASEAPAESMSDTSNETVSEAPAESNSDMQSESAPEAPAEE